MNEIQNAEEFIIDCNSSYRSVSLFSFGVGMILMLFGGFYGWSSGQMEPLSIFTFIPGLVIFLAGGITYIGTENYYIINPLSKEISYEVSIFGLKKKKNIAYFNEIKRVEIQGKHVEELVNIEGEPSYIRDLYYYWIAMVLKTDKSIRMNDLKESYSDIVPKEYISGGQKMADLIGCEFEPRGTYKHYNQKSALVRVSKVQINEENKILEHNKSDLSVINGQNKGPLNVIHKDGNKYNADLNNNLPPVRAKENLSQRLVSSLIGAGLLYQGIDWAEDLYVEILKGDVPSIIFGLGDLALIIFGLLLFFLPIFSFFKR